MNRREYPKSTALFARAAQVIPGGIYGHTSPAISLPGASPYYAARAKGCRYWDVDGHEFLDFMCGYGPIVLGYNHPEVEEAASRQACDGNCFNHPAEVMVELAERLVSLVDFAAWAVFGKNGADMTTWCTQVAREHTGAKKILKVAGAYHGSHPWCSPGHGGWIAEDRTHVHNFPWNDLVAFRDLVKKHRGQIAAVITTAFHHPGFGNSIYPAPGFLEGVQETCRKEGIVFILDDVRSGFRLHLGGSHRFFDFEPDLICFCKAIANGHPISAALGRADLQAAAGRVFLTGSYWNSAVPMAAALATLKIIERDNIIAKIAQAGAELRAGFERLSAQHDLPIHYTGHDSIPFVTFLNETNFLRSQHFCREAMQRGVFLHPHHNWFLCAAHETRDIAQALAAVDEAMAATKAAF
jgi:glutamate-1-semialdehyde 2,1-aminomutase